MLKNGGQLTIMNTKIKFFLIDFFLLVSGIIIIFFITPSGYFFSTIKKIYIFCVVVFPFYLCVKFVLLHFVYKKKNYFRLVFAICIFFTGIYATFIEPYMLFIKKIEIKSPKIKTPIKILHITDIQSTNVGWYEKKVFKKISELNPDIVCHTGDYLQNLRGANLKFNLKKLSDLVSGLPDTTYQFAVGGSTDYRYKLNEIFTGKNIFPLIDNSVEIKINNDIFRVIGLTEKSIFNLASPAVLNENISDTAYNILLGHQPDLIYHLRWKKNIDLCLAGHTHGGQVNIPLYGPIITMSGVEKKYARGFNKIENTYLNVSNGVGVEHLQNVMPIRLFCPPDITLITIKPE